SHSFFLSVSFFFSSRRRHTRSKRDWSSDVCSSDLFTAVFAFGDLMWPLICNSDLNRMTLSAGLSTLRGQFTTNFPVLMAGSVLRSEERRVGKEWGGGGWGATQKEKEVKEQQGQEEE